MPVDRTSLPSVATYLAQAGLLNQTPKREWVMVTCPVHKNGQEKNPSMSVNLTSGGFVCFACGAHGRDIIDLHRLRTGLGFVDAVNDLGGVIYE